MMHYLTQGRASAERQGVILLIVIILLTLFAVVGLAFILYADSEATASRIFREAQGLEGQRPDIPGSQLLNYSLGQLLFDNDVPPYDGSETWIDVLLRDPKHHDALVEEIHAVAREIAADPKYVDDEPLGPDDEARERFRAFAREKLARDTE